MEYLVAFDNGDYYRVVRVDGEAPRVRKSLATRFADRDDAERAAGDWNDYFAMKGRLERAFAERDLG